MENQEIATKFYACFAQLDAEGMNACYHPDIQFEDPAFGPLTGDRAKNMWRMLCDSQRGKAFIITTGPITVDGNQVHAHWEAQYTFSKTGRKIHNRIDAVLQIENGLIVKHQDHFNLYRWAQMALGVPGYLIGWTTYFKRKLKKQTNTLLNKYIAAQLSK